MNTFIILNRWNPIKKLIPNYDLKNIIYINNYSTNDIVERSRKIEIEWNKIEENQFNLIALSTSGIDLKVALSSNTDLKNKINKIGFVGTPHKGSIIAEMVDILDDYKLDRVIKLQGISNKAFEEYNLNNIENLDKYFYDFYNEKNDDLYNINCSKLLGELPENYKLLVNEANKNWTNIHFTEKLTDGLFYENETIHNNIKNLANLNLDQNNILLFKKYNGTFPFLDLLQDLFKDNKI